MQAGAGHPFSTHIALKYNVGIRLGLQESECITNADGINGAWQAG